MKRALWIIAFLCAFGAVWGARYVWELYHIESISLALPSPVFRAMRPIYPYSVLAGGATDGSELADLIAKDPVARKHYEGIQPDHMWVTTARKPMFVYVSYRKTNGIHWTDHEIKIPQGEVLLTDGTNLVRARCGNRIAFKRPDPLPAVVTPPEAPPPDIVFETPVPPLIPPTITYPPPPVITRRPPPPVVPPPPLWCCTENHFPPPPPIPEPATLVLVGSGLAGLAALKSRRKK